jgi:hypothetical protein
MVTLFGQHGVTDFEAWKRAAEANMSNHDRDAQMGIVESRCVAWRMATG